MVKGGITTTYSYDSRGNRLGMTVDGANGYTVENTFDKNNKQLASEKTMLDGSVKTTAYTYDNQGNLIKEISETLKPITEESEEGNLAIGFWEDDAKNHALAEYEYDAYNRLTHIFKGGVRADYTYTADGLRSSQTVNNITSRWVWDGTRLVKDGDTNYYYGLSLISSSAGNYYVLNGHGDVAALTNEQGEKVRAYSYSAFGIEENPDWDDENPFRYCGEYYDKGIGAIYLRARTYDPSTGRFTTEDPAKDGLNWYVYCSNNPIRYIDPTGFSGIKNDGSYYITHPLDQQLLQLKQEYVGASTKRKQEIAIEAQNIRNSGEEGVDWSVSADKPLDYYIIDTDITNKLNNLMKTAGDENFWKRFAKLNPVTNAARYANFAWMVRPGGQYDLKSKAEWQGKEHYIYNGEILWYDDPGNILYGYLGKAMGFEDFILLSAAGAVQIATGTSSWDYISSFFDDPRDQKSIQMGIQRFKDTNSWIWW